MFTHPNSPDHRSGHSRRIEFDVRTDRGFIFNRMVIHTVCWRVKRKPSVRNGWPGSGIPCMAQWMIVWMSVRHNRSDDDEAYPLRFS